MIDVARTDNRHRLEAAVRVLRETGHHVAVVHVPALRVVEVLADVVPGKRRGGTKPIVALRIVIDVVHAEQKRIGRMPARSERRHVDDVAHAPEDNTRKKSVSSALSP